MLNHEPTVDFAGDTRVCLTRITEYDVDKIEEAALAQLGALGIDPGNWAGKRVVLKPNLLLRFAPEKAATVHPALVEAVGRIFVRAGASVLLAESPGGPYNNIALEGIYSTSGMKRAAENAGFELNRDFTWRQIKANEGVKAKEFDVITPICEAELIISLCKLKSHTMATMTAGIKNLFGVIPGTEKVEFHARFREMKDFAVAVNDLTAAIAARTPLLTFCDAIVGMEGNGPSAGEPREIGCLLCSMNPFALDGVCGEIIGVGDRCPMLEEAKRRGYLPQNPENYRVIGDKLSDVRIKDFVFPDTSRRGILQRLPRFLEPRPVIMKKKCVGCGECARACPQKAITVKNRVAKIDARACIKCYCCQELCKIQAVKIHRSFIYKLVH
ncbi:MAG: DUF362 domain-containing protein [Clostridia bacterium]|nr:DUF362 domain-containing protein [Clostridia bacterium]